MIYQNTKLPIATEVTNVQEVPGFESRIRLIIIIIELVFGPNFRKDEKGKTIY